MLKQQVLFCLETYPATRNSDIALTIQIWKSYYGDKLYFSDKTKQWYVKLDYLFDLPREDNVKRIRAKIQNEEGLFLPTDEEVIKQRKLEEKMWRQKLGYGENNLCTG